jgi:hypothetical protein
MVYEPIHRNWWRSYYPALMRWKTTGRFLEVVFRSHIKISFYFFIEIGNIHKYYPKNFNWPLSLADIEEPVKNPFLVQFIFYFFSWFSLNTWYRYSSFRGSTSSYLNSEFFSFLHHCVQDTAEFLSPLIYDALFWYFRNSVDNSISGMSLLHEFSGCEQTKGYLRLIFKRDHILQKRLLNNILNKWKDLKIPWYIHFTKFSTLAWKNYL